jgi:hypothetical protein
MEDLMGGFMALRSADLHDVCCSPNVVTTKKKNIMKWEVRCHATVTYCDTSLSEDRNNFTFLFTIPATS